MTSEREPASEPISLPQTLASCDEGWDPQFVTTFNNYDVGVVKARGELVWHVHDDTDHFAFVLEGELVFLMRDASGERSVTLPKGAVFSVPRGTEHKTTAPNGASVMVLIPTGESTHGEHRVVVPDHSDETPGDAPR